MDSISDDELIDRIATVSVQSIRLQRAYRYRPLWQPALAKETTDRQDTDWVEAGRRGLRGRVHAEVDRRLGGPLDA